MIANNSNREDLVTVEATAKRLGLKESTIRAWIARRRLAYTKLGRAIRIPSSEIERLISAGFVLVLFECVR